MTTISKTMMWGGRGAPGSFGMQSRPDLWMHIAIFPGSLDGRQPRQSCPAGHPRNGQKWQYITRFKRTCEACTKIETHSNLSLGHRQSVHCALPSFRLAPHYWSIPPCRLSTGHNLDHILGKKQSLWHKFQGWFWPDLGELQSFWIFMQVFKLPFKTTELKKRGKKKSL